MPALGIPISCMGLEDESQNKQGFRVSLFLSAIDMVETASRLEAEPQSPQRAWLLGGYQQFRPFVCLLNEVQYRGSCAVVAHPWQVVESALSRWPPTS